MGAFPSGLASFTGFTPTHTLAQDNHASQHNLEQAEIVATQTKIGTGSSVASSGAVLTGSGNGTSAWAPVNLTTMVTGTLPVANGGTGTTSTTGSGSVVFGTSPTIATPAISNPTITGGGSWAGSPTISTPTIASFTNANHNHQNAAGGGKITSAAITSFDTSLTTISNPYKFRARRSGSLSTVASTFTLVPFDTEDFDTNNNFDITTNPGRYTAPVTGFYDVKGGIITNGNGGTFVICALYKNGSIFQRGSQLNATNAAGSNYADLVALTAGDYIELWYFIVNAISLDITPGNQSYFAGHLHSHT